MNYLNPPPTSHQPPRDTRRHSGVKPIGTKRTEEENSEVKSPTSHRPPRDTRRHIGVKPMGSKRTEIENSEKDGDDCIYVNEHGRACPYYLRRCKKKRLETKTDIINSLPDDVMLDILIRFPAEDIYGITRLVCRSWYKMIRTHKFVYAHLQRSAHGILIQNCGPIKSQLSFMSLQQGQIEITRLSYEPGYEIWCSCNGLILESERGDHCALRVTNPATMQHFNIPSFFCCQIAFTHSAIAYAAATMEYKVIRMYFPIYKESKTPNVPAILTVGVDSSWRFVRIQHLSPKAKKCFRGSPLITEGFVHWPRWSTFVLSLNIETEVITQYRVPPCLREGIAYDYFPAVRYLALLITRGRFSWDLWQMKPESGEWTKVTSIDLEAQKRTIEHLICERDTSFKLIGFVCCKLQPVGWLKYQQVLVFYVRKVYVYQESNPSMEGFGQQPRLCIAYNVHSKDIELIELDSIPDVFLAHRNGLVWLDGC